MKRWLPITAVILAALLYLSPGSALAQTKMLVVGGSQPYRTEAAFPASAISAHLQGILEGDVAISQPVTVQAMDTYQTESLSGFTSQTLMSWFYWPATHTNILNQLAGSDYVVMIDDPFVASQYPEYHLEGVMRIVEAVRNAGGIPVSVMT